MIGLVSHQLSLRKVHSVAKRSTDSPDKCEEILVEVDHVSKRIGSALVLDDISMSMHGGRIYGLLGANGSGKTMLMRAVCGLIRPSSGAVRINGKIVGKKDIPFPPSVGVLIENPTFLDGYTALGNLRLLAHIKNVVSDHDIRRILDDVGLDPDDRRTYRKFSLGMRQRLGIAAAVMENPRLIVLDEPTNGLAADGVMQLRALLNKQRQIGALIMVASHDRDELELMSDELFEIDHACVVGHRNLVREGAR